MTPRLYLAIALAVVAATPALAHHSIAAIYDSSRPVTLEGIVTEFAFIHPHPYLLMKVQPTSGAPEAWRLEMDNRFELAGIGVTSETFRPGDRLVVSGSPGRSQPLILYVRRLDRPEDGFEYEQVGSSPRIRPGR